MIRPYSIALLYGGECSRGYAEIMKQAILEESVYYPFIPVLIGTEYWEEKGINGAKVNDIMKELEKCDFVYLFLSAFYVGHDMLGDETSVERHIPKLNPIFEYGYLLKKLGDEKITIIPDFSYDEIEKGAFVFLSDKSDLLTSHRYKIDGSMKKDPDKLKKAFTTWFRKDMKVQGVGNISDRFLVDKLVFKCEKYTLDYFELFRQEVGTLNKYKLGEQIDTVLQKWSSEITEFDELESSMCFSYKTMYCYERLLLYLAIQKNDTSWISNLYFKLANIEYEDEQLAVIQIYNAICDYIQSMGDRKRENNSYYFLEKAQYLIERLKILPEGTNPLITVIAHNYIGLCYWNYYCLLSDIEKKRKVSALESAEKQYEIVIQACENGISPVLQEKNETSVMLSYVYFNRARICQVRGDDVNVWKRYYEKANVYRQLLSEKKEFPEFIRLHFLKEYFWSKLSLYKGILPFWLEQSEEEKIKATITDFGDINSTMKSYEQIYLEEKSNPFFMTIKNSMEEIERNILAKYSGDKKV